MNDTKRFTPKEIKVLKLDRQMGIVRFSPDGKFLAAGGLDATIRRWDEQLAELPPLAGHGGWVQALAFHPDGQRLFTTDSWGQILAWPFAEKEAKPLWSVKEAHDGWIRAVAPSPDGKRLASCGKDRVVRLWDVENGKKLQEIQGKEDTYSLAFHPDGKSLVCGEFKGVVREWDLETNKAAREFDAKVMHHFERLQDVGGVRCLAFDAKGTLLACGGGQPKSGGFVQAIPVILVFDWQTGKLLHTLKGANDNEGYVYDLHFHADGFLMAVTSGQPGNGRFFFHRPGEAQPFFTTPKMANCHSLAVHPAGQRLAVSATNANSAGNGRIGKGNYPGNFSPVHIWEMAG